MPRIAFIVYVDLDAELPNGRTESAKNAIRDALEGQIPQHNPEVLLGPPSIQPVLNIQVRKVK